MQLCVYIHICFVCIIEKLKIFSGEKIKVYEIVYYSIGFTKSRYKFRQQIRKSGGWGFATHGNAFSCFKNRYIQFISESSVFN